MFFENTLVWELQGCNAFLLFCVLRFHCIHKQSKNQLKSVFVRQTGVHEFSHYKLLAPIKLMCRSVHCRRQNWETNTKPASEACPIWKSVVRPHAISNPPLLPSPFPTQSSSVSLTNSADIANRVQHVTRLWLAIRFKITTGYTRVFLPRILVNIRYVWALSSYIRPFRSRIYAFLNGHIFA